MSSIGRGYIQAIGTMTINGVPTTGYFQGDLQSIGLTHGAENGDVRGPAGKTTGCWGNDEYLEGAFEFIPAGSTIANALIAAQLPEVPSGITMTGAPVFKIHPWDDAINTNGAGINANPWIYKGGGRVNGSNSGAPWTLSVTLRRYQGISSATVIT